MNIRLDMFTNPYVSGHLIDATVIYCLLLLRLTN